jgi:hypothetical protein
MAGTSTEWPLSGHLPVRHLGDSTNFTAGVLAASAIDSIVATPAGARRAVSPDRLAQSEITPS